MWRDLALPAVDRVWRCGGVLPRLRLKVNASKKPLEMCGLHHDAAHGSDTMRRIIRSGIGPDAISLR